MIFRRGEFRGKIGLFPDNFVKIISANEGSNNNKPASSAMTLGPKIQERNLTGVKPITSNEMTYFDFVFIFLYSCFFKSYVPDYYFVIF